MPGTGAARPTSQRRSTGCAGRYPRAMGEHGRSRLWRGRTTWAHPVLYWATFILWPLSMLAFGGVLHHGHMAPLLRACLWGVWLLYPALLVGNSLAVRRLRRRGDWTPRDALPPPQRADEAYLTTVRRWWRSRRSAR
jgi:hypothetical protein